MAVRDALLSILLAGPAYGFQLHGELAARTGGRRVINVGQTYGTLDRLTARGLIEPAGATDDGRPLHRITERGRDAALAWLHGVDAPVSDPWDETVDRVLIAASLPGVAFDTVVARERERWTERRDLAGAAPTGASASLSNLAASLEAARAATLLDWIDGLAAEPPQPFPISSERPRRGRRPAPRHVAADDAQPASA